MKCTSHALHNLINVIREDISILTLLAEILCLLDMTVNSFANMISTKPLQSYSRPEFTENGPMAIDAGRHPILESVRKEFVQFMNEMKETSFLMQNVSPSYTVFATHMEALSEMVTLYPNVKVLHFEVDLRNNHLDFKFHLKDGLRHVPHYGLLLASVAGLPSSVIESAREITARFTEKDSKRMNSNYEQYESLQVVYRIAQRLICLKYSNQGEDSIRMALDNLKDSYKEGRVNF
ncbi:hypothetical protein HPP92_025123 [Vanilla planifolia]|uniref:DNA mismatch repair proteins mutS family domain-containing protein n=1 Tax=Vanilla planifolia TaxID=51239 RepID=A0A835U8Q2_VANPL|nr:hypothetical protein HPP92_025123 [Vanilla planifolia]